MFFFLSISLEILERGKVISSKMLQTHRPTLVVPTGVSTSVKEIWICNLLLLEALLVKFIPAPKPFWRKYALGWVWFLNVSICRILRHSRTGGGSFVAEA